MTKTGGFLVALAAVVLPLTGYAGLTLEQEEALREKAANRQRRIIFNNDGNEPVYYCETADPQELLALRTAPLANTQVDSIFYCTWSSGFGVFTHDTKVGQVFDIKKGIDDKGVNRFAGNVTADFIEAGTDPLKIVAGFCRENEMEVFWSMRMNDTHDGSSAWYGPVMFAVNQLKNEHPEWLIGERGERIRHGAWSAVDYGVAEIRDLAFRYVEEVCQNYDIDGVELDFFRHPVFFQSAANGTPCSQQERDEMTGLMRRIRQMARTEGAKRGRPILLAIRVPDSVEFCRQIGIDLEAWLQEGLVDLLVPSGYFQLNPWEYSVALGHKYGVKVYPSLDESRVRDKEAGALRRSVAAYRGRAQNVLHSGADGVYLFNYSDLFKSKFSLMKSMGSTDTLKGLDKVYFASVRGLGGAAGGTLPHRPFTNIPTLNPRHPLKLSPGKPTELDFPVGEDFSSTDQTPELQLVFRFAKTDPGAALQITLNGHLLEAATVGEDGLRSYSIQPTQLKAGSNHLSLLLDREAPDAVEWSDVYLRTSY